MNQYLTPPAQESVITERWHASAEQPTVSICCITYNHEDYIRTALDSFLAQKTDFAFEILIHDDASTDKTTDIIREYEARYPNIIKPLIQTKNQRSIKKGINPRFNFPRARGKYIATCEGDDYWISADKLKSQVKLLAQDKTLSMVFHPVYDFNNMTAQTMLAGNHYPDDKIVPTRKIIRGRGGYIPTTSIMFEARHKDVITELFNQNNFPVGDYFIQSYLALIGKVGYQNQIMATYRRYANSSWSNEQQNIQNQLRHSQQMLEAIRNFYQNPFIQSALQKNTSHFAYIYLRYQIIIDNIHQSLEDGSESVDSSNTLFLSLASPKLGFRFAIAHKWHFLKYLAKKPFKLFLRRTKN